VTKHLADLEPVCQVLIPKLGDSLSEEGGLIGKQRPGAAGADIADADRAMIRKQRSIGSVGALSTSRQQEMYDMPVFVDVDLFAGGPGSLSLEIGGRLRA
jgi:hypothetical protein